MDDIVRRRLGDPVPDTDIEMKLLADGGAREGVSVVETAKVRDSLPEGLPDKVIITVGGAETDVDGVDDADVLSDVLALGLVENAGDGVGDFVAIPLLLLERVPPPLQREKSM